jgi:hypothetical protein
MQHAHIDISRGLDGERVVLACFDLREDELAAAARAVAAVAAERYRTPRISADDVLELRELTALADELEHGSRQAGSGQGMGSVHGPDPERGIEPGHAEAGRGIEPASEIQPGRGTEPGRGPDLGLGIDSARGVEPGQGIRTLVFKPARLSVLRDAVAAFVASRDEAEWIREEDREPLALLRGLLIPLEQLCAEAMRAAVSPESHVG